MALCHAGNACASGPVYSIAANTDRLVVRLWKDDDNTYHLRRDVGR